MKVRQSRRRIGSGSSSDSIGPRNRGIGRRERDSASRSQRRQQRPMAAARGESAKKERARRSISLCHAVQGDQMSQSHGRVLIVDDEIAIRRALHNTLHGMGFEVDDAASGEAALERVGEAEFDVVLMDINMPGMGGIRACREIRKSLPQLAILMLTVRDREEDKVTALDAGADDYITKPFNIRELAARIRAAVRRSSASRVDPDAVIRIGNIELDPARRLVRKGGEPVHFTPIEFDLLRYLMTHAGLPITHVRLLRAVWGPEYGGELEYLRTYIRQLRKKLEDDPAEPEYLLTDSHVGYRFAEGVPEGVEEKVP